MQDHDSVQRIGRGSMAQVFIWGGVLLLLVGGVLLYPYVGSRVTVPPPTPTSEPHASPTPAPSATPAHIPTRAPVLTFTIVSPVPQMLIPTPRPAIPDHVVIPAIDLSARVVPVSWTTVEVDGQDQPVWGLPETRAAGWHETSASLGVPGNTVLNGHNTSNGEVFRDLYRLETGDEVILYSGEVVCTYTVTEVLVLPEAGQPLEVRVENARYIQPTDDERLTLVTCHPYGSLRNRLIVIAHPAAECSRIDDDYFER
jgi:sortase A